MFKDYQIVKIKKHPIGEVKITIFDDDFTEENIYQIMPSITIIVFDLYKQKQLPVAPNFVLLLKKIKEKIPQEKIDKIIYNMDCYCPDFKPYKEEVKKLLIFI